MEQRLIWGGATHQLVSKEQNSLETELAVAEVEEVLKRGAKQVENHGIVVTFCAVPANERDTNATGKSLVNFGLILELRVLGLD